CRGDFSIVAFASLSPGGRPAPSAATLSDEKSASVITSNDEMRLVFMLPFIPMAPSRREAAASIVVSKHFAMNEQHLRHPAGCLPAQRTNRILCLRHPHRVFPAPLIRSRNSQRITPQQVVPLRIRAPRGSG